MSNFDQFFAGCNLHICAKYVDCCLAYKMTLCKLYASVCEIQTVNTCRQTYYHEKMASFTLTAHFLTFLLSIFDYSSMFHINTWNDSFCHCLVFGILQILLLGKILLLVAFEITSCLSFLLK